ncbi:MAG: hypothetical protein WAO83_02825 [Fuerstiella sp.]
MDRKLVIYVDVDDTLIRSVGTKQIPMPASVDYVRRMHAAGNTLYCWSRGGADYSRDVATSLGIAECFVSFLAKPDILLDDFGDALLNHCQFILPGNASNHQVGAVPQCCVAAVAIQIGIPLNFVLRLTL